MKKYIKPIQQVYKVSTCNNILGASDGPGITDTTTNVDDMETKGEKNGSGIWDLYN